LAAARRQNTFEGQLGRRGFIGRGFYRTPGSSAVWRAGHPPHFGQADDLGCNSGTNPPRARIREVRGRAPRQVEYTGIVTPGAGSMKSYFARIERVTTTNPAAAITKLSDAQSTAIRRGYAYEYQRRGFAKCDPVAWESFALIPKRSLGFSNSNRWRTVVRCRRYLS
jgi:hypothetical protein